MNTEAFINIETKNQHRIFCRLWKLKQPKAKRVAVICHGMGEHGGRYLNLAEGLKPSVSEFIVPDHVGHGRSGGLRGHVEHFDDFAADLADVMDQTLKEIPSDYEVILFGHSMGGLIALRGLQKKWWPRVDRAIISAPLLGVAMPVPNWKLKFGQILNKSLYKLQLSSELNPKLLSHDSRVVADYVADRLVHSKCTPRQFFQMMQIMEEVKQNNKALPCPTAFLVPLADEIVDPQATLAFFHALEGQQGVDKTMFSYEGFYHESFNEVERRKVFSDLNSWLER